AAHQHQRHLRRLAAPSCAHHRDAPGDCSPGASALTAFKARDSLPPLDGVHVEADQPVAVRGQSRALIVFLGLITLIMLAQAGMTGYLLVTTERQRKLEEERAAAYQDRLVAVSKVAQDQRDALAKLQDVSKEAVYNDKEVKGLLGQEFRAIEMIFQELQ